MSETFNPGHYFDLIIKINDRYQKSEKARIYTPAEKLARSLEKVMNGGKLENLEKNELLYDVERTGDEDLRELATGLLGVAEKANESARTSLSYLVTNIRRVLTNA